MRKLCRVTAQPNPTYHYLKFITLYTEKENMFKKIIKYIIISTSLFTLSVQADDVYKSQEELADKTFRLLQKLDSISFEDYKKELASKEQVRLFLTNNLKDNELLAREVKKLDKEFEKKQKEDFEDLKNIKTLGIEDNIVWKDIIFSGFTYESIESFGKDKIYDMFVYFSYKNKYYQASLRDFKKSNNQYLLLSISNLYTTNIDELKENLQDFAKQQKK